MTPRDEAPQKVRDLFQGSLQPGPVETCSRCQRPTPKEWIPPVEYGGRPLISSLTGWQSQLTNGLCPGCYKILESGRLEVQRRKNEEIKTQTLTKKLSLILGGDYPVQNFTFERFQVTPDNEPAYQAAVDFDPHRHNLYLWGDSSVGKTHLACAIARKSLWEGFRVEYTKPDLWMLRLRSKDPSEQLRMIEEASRVPVWIFDEFGTGVGADSETTRQTIQNLLDMRHFAYQSGMVVTTNFSPEELAEKYSRTLPSRIIEMFTVVRVQGDNWRLKTKAADPRPGRPFLPRSGERRERS